MDTDIVAIPRPITARMKVVDGIPVLRMSAKKGGGYRELPLAMRLPDVVSRVPIISDDMDGPQFTVNEVARIFFARTQHWLRYHEKQGDFKRDGEDMIIARTSVNRKGGSGDRRFYLSDVEWICHAFFENNVITEETFFIALEIIWMMALQYDLIDSH